jgi:hypothetical protein
MELIRRFPADVLAAALSDWQWLPELTGKQPLVTSAFGDVFLRGEDGVWFLDTVEGNVSRQWDSPNDLQQQLNTRDGQDRFLMAGLVETAVGAGLVAGQGEVLSFKVPPVLGGQFDVDNLDVTDLVVALSVAGQIHRQVKDLPPGTQVSGVTVDGDDRS